MFDKNAMTLPGARGVMVVLASCALADALLIVGQAWGLASALTLAWGLAGSLAGAAFSEGLADAAASVALFAACYLLRQVVAYGRGRYLDAYAQKRASALRGALADRLYEGGQAFVQRHGRGVTTVALVDGIDQVKTYLALIFPKIVDLMVVPVVLTVALFAIDWVSGLIALVLLPCIIWYMRMLGAHAREAAVRQHGEYERLSNHFMDTMRGIPTLKYFGRSRGYAQRVYQVSERFREATVQTLKTATLSSLVLDLFRTFALAAVAIMLGFRLMAGWVALLPALACLIIVPEYFAPLRRYASDFHASLDGANQLASILRMVGGAECATQGASGADERALQRGVPSPTTACRGASGADEGALQPGSVVAAENVRGASASSLSSFGSGNLEHFTWSETSELRFEDVCFSYGLADEGAGGPAPGTGSLEPGVHEAGPSGPRPDSGSRGGEDAALALEGVSFEVKGFAKVGLVGPSGSGKSTLAQIIAGFYRPTAGKIALADGAAEAATLRVGEVCEAGGGSAACDAGCVDVRRETNRRGVPMPVSLADASWLSQVTYIPQNPHIFSATLRDNVAFYCPDASDEQVAEAVAAVGLDELVGELPDGLDTLVGQGGRALSGGQAQRVALARALLDERRRIWVLDESTAHLDIETELELKERMLPLMEGRLVVFATHRMHWVDDMDLVVVLHNGRVEFVGAPTEAKAVLRSHADDGRRPSGSPRAERACGVGSLSSADAPCEPREPCESRVTCEPLAPRESRESCEPLAPREPCGSRVTCEPLAAREPRESRESREEGGAR